MAKKNEKRNKTKRKKRVLISDMLRRHFAPIPFGDLTVSERKFPFRVRADIQRAIDELLADRSALGFCGVLKEYSHEGIDFPALMTESSYPAVPVPPQYEEVDVGDEEPVRCLKNGLWLLSDRDTRYAVPVIVTQIPPAQLDSSRHRAARRHCTANSRSLPACGIGVGNAPVPA